MDTNSKFYRALGQHRKPPPPTHIHHLAYRAPAISIERAFAISLQEHYYWQRKRTVISTYELAAEFATMVRCWNWDVYKLWQGHLLELTRREVYKYRQMFLDKSFLYRVEGVTGGFLAFQPYVEADELISQIDPYGRFAYATAMHSYGLLKRAPDCIYTKSPPRQKWRQLADAEMAELGLPLNDLPRMSETSPAAVTDFQWVRVRDSRMTNFWEETTGPGEMYLDMLRHPQKCAGWPAIFAAFRVCEPNFVSSIIREVDACGTLADKARMGFMLEHSGLVERAPDAWADAISSGGSLKLDAAAPFVPGYSPRWKLSLNVPEATGKI